MNKKHEKVKGKSCEGHPEQANINRQEHEHYKSRNGEQCREPMREFHSPGMGLANKNSAATKIKDLFVELTEVSSSFMINVGFRYQANFKPGISYPKTQLDILREPVELVAPQF